MKILLTCRNGRALERWEFIALNYFGYMKGIEYTTASNSQVMIQMAPTLLIIAGILVFKEIPTWKQWLGMFIAAVGFYLFNGDQLQFSIEKNGRL